MGECGVWCKSEFDAKSIYEWKICESACVSGKNDEADEAKSVYEWKICEFVSLYMWV